MELFVRHLARDPATFNPSIDKKDEMYQDTLTSCKGDAVSAMWHYLDTGKRMRDVIKQIVEWGFGGFDNLSSLMDFACGYGRVTRFLVQDMPAGRIWASDIYSDAVGFQVEQFGVNGVVSAVKPENYNNANRYDFIFVASLFSHLPEKTFHSWLKKLYSLLSPTGLLVFSVHDIELKPQRLKAGKNGICFVSESESGSLDKQSYGTSYVSEAFVNDAIAGIPHDTAASVHIKRGLNGFQDLYIVSRDTGRDFSRLDFNYGPSGWLDKCGMDKNGEVYFLGWAADFNKDTSLSEVQLFINNNIVQRCTPGGKRPDVAEHFQNEKGMNSGWSFSLQKGSVSPGDIVTIIIINSREIENILRIGTLESMLTA